MSWLPRFPPPSTRADYTRGPPYQQVNTTAGPPRPGSSRSSEPARWVGPPHVRPEAGWRNGTGRAIMSRARTHANATVGLPPPPPSHFECHDGETPGAGAGPCVTIRTRRPAGLESGFGLDGLVGVGWMCHPSRRHHLPAPRYGSAFSGSESRRVFRP